MILGSLLKPLDLCRQPLLFLPALTLLRKGIQLTLVVCHLLC